MTLQGSRYGFCPYPNAIVEFEFRQMKEYLQRNGGFEDTMHLLEEPYWRLDETAFATSSNGEKSNVFVLQPVSSLPDCGNFFLSEEEVARGKQDEDFRNTRETERKASSEKWWKIFESTQKLFQEGSKALPEEDRKKYLISVTHDEVTRGILSNPNCKVQSIYFERNISGIDDALAKGDPVAAVYKDSIKGSEGGGAERIPDPISAQKLDALRVDCKSRLNADQIYTYPVNWIGDGKLDKKALNPPDEWKEYLETFSVDVLKAICFSFIADYKIPVQDEVMSEAIIQHDNVASKLKNFGFSRDGLINDVISYISGVDESASSSQYNLSKAFVIEGSSGVGKSWIMCQVNKSRKIINNHGCKDNHGCINSLFHVLFALSKSYEYSLT